MANETKDTQTLDAATANQQTSSEAETNIQHVQLEQLERSEQHEGAKSNLGIIMDVEVPVSVELGRTEMSIGGVLELGPGSVVELNKMASDPVDLYVNNKLIARGEVVVVDENFGIRITSVVESKERIRSLGT